MSVTLDALANYVTAKQADPEFIATGDIESAALYKFMDKKKIKGGALQNFTVKNDSQATNFEWILPDDTSDVVGGGATNEYTALDPVAQPQFTWSFGTTNLRYSNVQYQQAKTGGKSQLADYLDSRLEYTNSEMVTKLGAGIITGTGGGLQTAIVSTAGTQPVPYPSSSNAAQPYGLIYQDRYYSGTANANTAGTTSVSNSNTHFGKSRHLYKALVSNVFDASAAGYGTTFADAGVTLTNGSTEISSITSTDMDAYIGWEVWVDLNAGSNYKRLGRTVIADAATGAATTIQMSSVYEGATDTSVNLELRAPYSTAVHGTSGIVNPQKLNKAYFAASNGQDKPDMGLCDNDMFAAIYNDLFSIQRWTLVRDGDMETKGYDNFKFHRATMCMDLNAPSGEIHFVNTKYTKMYCLEGMTDYKIQGKDLIHLPSQTGFEQFGAAKVFPFQLASQSPRSNARIINLQY
ncbi:hypothetical protein [uncultured Paraglaciecola sp.]|uniref:hypothetical protein n=1 Tax=uncultured Paraglaciecola sp. TaxID=1765024 RepID=UPI002611FEFA|nr:hypothetical protein [uncultured Paraglaciecola sp.]